MAGVSETREINNIFRPFFTVPAKSIPTATRKNSPTICINRVFSDNVRVLTLPKTNFYINISEPNYKSSLIHKRLVQ